MKPRRHSRMKLAEAIRTTAEQMLQRDGEGHPIALWEQVKSQYAELVEADAWRLADQRGLSMCRDVLRPTAQQQDEIPGFGALPRTFTVPDGEGDFRYVSVKKATLGNVKADLGIKDVNLAACQAERNRAFDDCRRLWSVRGANENMLVTEAIRRLRLGLVS